jgi:hypothetical protein
MDNLKTSRDMLRAIYDELRDRATPNYENTREDFAFHILECVDDISELLRLLDQPKEAAAAARQIVGFLYHVVPHMNAATRLLLGEIPDPFAGVPASNIVR